MGFRRGNFVSLRDIPNDMSNGNVLQAVKDKIEANIREKAEPKLYVELANGGGYFSKFEWKPDPFSRYLEKQYYESALNRERIKHVHGDQVYNVTTKVPTQVKHVSTFDAVSGTTGVWASFLF
jgi:hypothetical protein